jgi:uncharacterized protein (TIGR02246 family)
MRMRRVNAVDGAFLRPSTCTSLAGNTEVEMPNTADFQKMADQFCAAYNDGQPEAGVEAYAEDACVVAPDGRLARGREQIRALFTDRAKRYADLHVKVDEVHEIADGVVVAILTSTGVDQSSKRRLTGRGIATLRSEEHVNWQVVAHAWADH